jgi:pimeloyl-ACP methyl ester carboxylesterase
MTGDAGLSHLGLPSKPTRKVLMRGAKSQLFQAADAAYLMSLIAPGSPYVEIPEAEHHVMIHQPLAFVSALKALPAAWPAFGNGQVQTAML